MAETQRHNTTQWVGFHLAGQAYAFPIERIREIVIPERITRTPQVPSYCEGVSNLRGSIIPIINLRTLFDLEPRPHDADARTIVVHVGERTMGCLVDDVTQVVRIADDDIQPAPETIAGPRAPYITGFTRLDETLVILLDIELLLNPASLERRAERAAPSEPSP